MIPHTESSGHLRPTPALPSVRAEDEAEPVGGTQFLRLLVQQSGPQRTTVTITDRHDSPVLHVRAGGVFVYACTPEVVAAHLTAWRDTSPAALQVFRSVGSGRPVVAVVTETAELSVIVRQDRAPAVAVTQYPADRTRPGRPAYIETVTGPLATRSYDRVSISDTLGVWLQAAALGAIVWCSPALADL